MRCFEASKLHTFSYTSFMAAKLSMSFKYTFTLTTFSQEEPDAVKTFPKFLMHWVYVFKECVPTLDVVPD